MREQNYSYKFIVSEKVHLEEHNKLYLDDLHLFTCHEDAIILLKSAIENTNKFGYFDIIKIKNDLLNCSIIQQAPDSDQFIYDAILYLVKCGVFNIIE